MKSRYTNVKYHCEISWYFSVHCLPQSLRNYKEGAKIKPSEKALAMPGQLWGMTSVSFRPRGLSIYRLRILDRISPSTTADVDVGLHKSGIIYKIRAPFLSKTITPRMRGAPTIRGVRRSATRCDVWSWFASVKSNEMVRIGGSIQYPIRHLIVRRPKIFHTGNVSIYLTYVI